MPDLGHSDLVANQDKAEFLSALAVQLTQDEHGKPRYMITDGTTGDWIGDPFDNPVAAFEEIEAMRKDGK